MSVTESAVRVAGPGRILHLELKRGGGELTIVMALVVEGSSNPVTVRFRGASDVRFRGERTELTEIVLLLAERSSANGLEARFFIKDYEEEFISFVCRGFETQTPSES